MGQRGGFFYLLKVMIILALAGTGFFCGQKIMAAEKININTAALAELDSLPGIGPAKAQAIIDYRTTQPFSAIEDVMKVSGIKQATFDAIKDLITVSEAPAQPVENLTASSTETAVSPPAETAGTSSAGEDVLSEYDFSSQIYISEIFPNPAGDDAGGEFIELFNGSAREVNLTGWSLSNQSGKKKYLQNIASSTSLAAGKYLALFRSATKIVLRNDNGEVSLFAPLADKPFRAVAYKDVVEGLSYNRFDDNDWVWSQSPTPGKANLVKSANRPPEADFGFTAPAWVGSPVKLDSSDSYDEDGDRLKFSWDFGDGFKNNLANPEHTYLKAGVYNVKLEVSDGKETGIKEKSVKVMNGVGRIGDVNEIAALPPVARNDNLVINEVFPNPAGADTGKEWLEIKNQSEEKINLLNWRVENENGKYKFKNDLWLEAGDFYLLNGLVSKLAFKNVSDAIYLYNNSDELIDKAEYADAIQGESYARGKNGNWFWTTAPTPREENIIKVSGSKTNVKPRVLGIKESVDEYAETDLEEVGELEIGSLVKIKGIVAALPGILGAQIFYIASASSPSGMQIYNYKKYFPALRQGDYIEVRGELARAQGELRIKTKDKNNIKIIGHKPEPVALDMSIDAISEENIGQLIAVSGEITDKKSSTLYLDDGSGEILVYIKRSTGITTKNLAAGQNAAVSGILSKTPAGFKLLPRYQNDITAVDGKGSTEPRVLGEVAAADEWEVAARDKKTELLKYLLAVAAGIIIILAGLFVKAVKKAP